MPDVFVPLSLGLIGWAALLVAGALLGLFALARWLPALPLTAPHPTDPARPYRLNGLLVLLLVDLALTLATIFDLFPLTRVLAQFWALLLAAAGLVLAWGGWLFLRARRVQPPKEALRRAWQGVEVGRVVARQGLKPWSYQPALIGWHVLALGAAAQQYAATGTLSTAMLVHQAGVLAYVGSHFVHEASVVATWAVQREGLGVRWLGQQLIWTPFLFSTLAWPLIGGAPAMGTMHLLLVLGLMGLGLWLLRTANAQKAAFRLDPAGVRFRGRRPDTIAGKLLAEGWWGVVRHANLLGEMLFFLGLAATAGVQSVWPYLVWFLITAALILRLRLLEADAADRYGEVWEAYRSQVRFRLIPRVW